MLYYGNDSLVWVFNEVGGDYSIKLRYKTVFNLVGINPKWWWNKLWKSIAPSNAKIIKWLYLNGKVLTWDQLVKRGKEGSRICLLCIQSDETNFHLFVCCHYTVLDWNELEKIMGQ